MGQDHGSDFIERAVFTHRPGDELPRSRRNAPSELFEVFILEAFDHRRQRERILFHGVRIEVHPDFALEPADDVRARYAGNGQELVLQPVVRPGAELHQVPLVRADGDLSHRQLGRVGLDHNGGIDVFGQLPGYPRHRRQGVLIGHIDVHAVLEVRYQRVHALDGGRLHVVEAVHRGDLPLDGISQVDVDFIGGRSPPPDVNPDHGVSHVRKEVHRELQEPIDPEHDQGDGDHSGADAALDRNFGYFHWAAPERTWTSAPSLSFSLPETITWSPAWMPLTI